MRLRHLYTPDYTVFQQCQRRRFTISYFVKNCPKIMTSLLSPKLNSSFVLNQRNGQCENEISSLSFSHTQKILFTDFLKKTQRQSYFKISPPNELMFYKFSSLFSKSHQSGIVHASVLLRHDGC